MGIDWFSAGEITDDEDVNAQQNIQHTNRPPFTHPITESKPVISILKFVFISYAFYFTPMARAHL